MVQVVLGRRGRRAAPGAEPEPGGEMGQGEQHRPDCWGRTDLFLAPAEEDLPCAEPFLKRLSAAFRKSL